MNVLRFGRFNPPIQIRYRDCFFSSDATFLFFFAIDSCYFEVRGNGIDGEINGGGILRGVYGSK